MNKSGIDQKKQDRSTAYPSLTVERALELLRELRNAGGKGPYSKAFIAKCLNHKALSGPANSKIAALTYYGLLEKNGAVYSLCKNVEDFFNPVNDEDRISAVVAAIAKPNLFAKLLQEFGGSALPSKLDAILIRDGVSPTVAQSVAEIFVKNLEFAKLYDNGLVGSVSSMPVNSGQDIKPVSIEGPVFSSPARLAAVASMSRGKEVAIVTDFGAGWTLQIQSRAPLTAKTKKLLIEVGEALNIDNSIKTAESV